MSAGRDGNSINTADGLVEAVIALVVADKVREFRQKLGEPAKVLGFGKPTLNAWTDVVLDALERTLPQVRTELRQKFIAEAKAEEDRKNQ